MSKKNRLNYKPSVKVELLRNGDQYRWQREDGEWVSPVFFTIEAAYYMAGRLPFLTDEQWKKLHPMPARKGPPS